MRTCPREHCNRGSAKSGSRESNGNARPAGSFFFPLDQHLELGTEGYSPAVIRLAVHKAQGFACFKAASLDLKESLDVGMSPKHMERLCRRVGEEWSAQRDRQVESYQRRQLPRDYPKAAPAAAAVMVDSGRVQTRQENQPPGVYQPAWKATNVACCLTLKSQSHQEDPQPEPPRKFLDPPKVQQLVAQIHARGGGEKPPVGKQTPKRKNKKRRSKESSRKNPNHRKGPVRLVRTTVATMLNWEQFGWQVAAEAHRRSLDLAARKAYVCDGQACNWTLFEMHFQASGFVAILDILHLLGYLYAAALAIAGEKGLWPRYERWLRLAWAGRSGVLLQELKSAAGERGVAPRDAAEGDPRRVLAEAVRYVSNNQSRMDYPRYRKLGLPISSAPVESVIKQYNQRIKGSEKFWLPAMVEAMQQIRAAYLCDDGRAEKYWNLPRPHRHAVGGGRLNSAAA